MEHGVYDAEARLEAEHWWFRGRRMLFAAELRGLKIGTDAGVLDIGTGTGSNLRMAGPMIVSKFSGVNQKSTSSRRRPNRGGASCRRP